ncbi:hypothetical protein ElyMa_005578400 [Elysia marginata]|uniref:Uncharacterized protein n=1 Tax=Elysia marginata TaxID=1093978 RepID=A0AAV4F356_9GAST|nr:hypothetical protein ElyMa_005578400 [Elysia marginata]
MKIRRNSRNHALWARSGRRSPLEKIQDGILKTYIYTDALMGPLSQSSSIFRKIGALWVLFRQTLSSSPRKVSSFSVDHGALTKTKVYRDKQSIA